MKRIRRSKKRGPVVSKKVTYDGIKFASGLEKYMYIALKQNSIKAEYEKRTFVLIPEFYFNMKVMKEQQTLKVNLKTEVLKKYNQ